jgi:hypothetical protein
MAVNYEDLWHMQDEIAAAVNALGYTVWDLHYDPAGGLFRLELNEHPDEDALSLLSAHLPMASDYNGEGSHGARLTLIP